MVKIMHKNRKFSVCVNKDFFVKILQRLKNGCVIVVSLLNTVHVVPSFFNLSLGVIL
jgi:hypothetical protein